jgi:hypothetical protein
VIEEKKLEEDCDRGFEMGGGGGEDVEEGWRAERD